MGSVAGIFIGAVAEMPLQSKEEVLAVTGRGLEGDRYFDGSGTYSTTPGTGRHVTLIESEALAAAESDYGLELPPGASRRNIVTAGVALNHLVGREFMVGEVRLLGTRLCEPCSHLAKLTGKPVVKALIHRAGLRADILDGGLIRVGDEVKPVEVGLLDPASAPHR
jgi:MOSC domain-containing protein YiiM